MITKHTTFSIILAARSVHGFKYKYDKVIYINNNTKIIVTCEDHGDFSIRASNHVSMGQGCAKCCSKLRADSQSSNTLEFIRKASNIHPRGDYEYSKVDYQTSRKKVTILCNKCGDAFVIVPNEHLRGAGCPNCYVGGGFKKHLPATLYYLQVGNSTYKIGITNHSIRERFSNSELKNIKVIKEWYYEDGAEAFAQEQKILKEFRYAKYEGSNLLESGNTELFTHDVLGLAY